MTNSERTSVLITGGNQGRGLETARRLGVQGWTIFLGSRDEGRGPTAADKLTDGGAASRTPTLNDRHNCARSTRELIDDDERCGDLAAWSCRSSGAARSPTRAYVAGDP
ncbi:hypothetical protein [Nonomuraea sp. NPDC050643]|uniref:hypothetical protein n=1 Tax=Nonomuraea sp. NPDC050643 TaxID=3155660 RepID=UPI0033EE8A15